MIEGEHLEPRTGGVEVNELRELYPAHSGDVVFTVRGLSERELYAVRAIRDTELAVELLWEAIGGRENGPELKYHCEIICSGSVSPKIDSFFAIRLARDFKPVLLRLSEKILELSAPGLASSNLLAVIRLQ